MINFQSIHWGENYQKTCLQKIIFSGENKKRQLENFCQDEKRQLLKCGLDVSLTGQKSPYLH